MNTPITPESQLLPRGKRKGVVGFVAAAAVTLVAVPTALAAVWSINEVQSDWTLTDCLSKSESTDGASFDSAPTDNYYINFDPTTTSVDSATGVAVLHETLSVRAPAGFRTFSTDTFTVDADACGYDYTVSLTALPTNSFGEDAVPVTADWADKGVKLYLSEVANPGDDFTNAADWDQDPLIVNSTGAVVNADTGTAVLVDDANLVVGFELVGGTSAAPTPPTGNLNFQVNFIPIP